MHLIVVSSLDALCRREACGNLAAEHPGSLVVFHDLLENGLVIRRVFDAAGPVEYEETILEHGCLSCAVRLDLVPAIDRLAASAQGPIIIGLPPAVPASVAVTALNRGLSRPATVSSAIIALAPDALEDHIWDPHTLFESGFTPVADDERTPGEFLLGELAFADTVLVAEPDIVPADPAGRERGLHLLRELAPHAHLAAGTVQVRRSAANAAASPFVTVVQRMERPLHPGRFRQVLGTLAEGYCVLQGHLWVASAPECRIAIQGIGPRVWLENTGTWPEEPAATGQAGRAPGPAATVLAATGEGLDPAEFERLLRDCELTDDELAAGTVLPDPFGLRSAS
ncbi:GTP-binding protein [Arthrobacter nitrophenolicus]|uniref:GTP-binding protein n=1 Tax=Arthrobacter nitrophenolicus TaxID=683150 RepID=A0A4R5Y695_9MICC|nr:GTP-binding protein [Arthrobacter nitrophenolicus]TDL38642.1 GTP-binding protein [Arthrobacter nitrophenolicus]